MQIISDHWFTAGTRAGVRGDTGDTLDTLAQIMGASLL